MSQQSVPSIPSAFVEKLFIVFLNIFQVENLFTEAAEIRAEVAEKTSLDQANRVQKLGLVRKKERKSAKLSMTIFASRSHCYLYSASSPPPPTPPCSKICRIRLLEF